MDVIYSRYRIRKKNIKNKKTIKIFIIILVAILTSFIMLKSISPIFEELCKEKIKNIATIIINEEINNILNNINYEEIVLVKKDENSNNIVKTDVTLINKIASEASLKIEERFRDLENSKIQIPLGALTGSKLISGSGPNINLKVISTQNVNTEIKTEFKEQGINQTIYRIYLEIKGNVSILTPYKTINDEITNKVLLVETVILGNVPETYYNLEDMNNEDTTNLIN